MVLRLKLSLGKEGNSATTSGQLADEINQVRDSGGEM